VGTLGDFDAGGIHPCRDADLDAVVGSFGGDGGDDHFALEKQKKTSESQKQEAPMLITTLIYNIQ
jgi:hypothetical protein